MHRNTKARAYSSKIVKILYWVSGKLLVLFEQFDKLSTGSQGTLKRWRRSQFICRAVIGKRWLWKAILQWALSTLAVFWWHVRWWLAFMNWSDWKRVIWRMIHQLIEELKSGILGRCLVLFEGRHWWWAVMGGSKQREKWSWSETLLVLFNKGSVTCVMWHHLDSLGSFLGQRLSTYLLPSSYPDRSVSAVSYIYILTP